MSGARPSSLAVDVSLLAVLIALHVTEKNKNFELVIMALLFSHLIMTTELFFSKLPSTETTFDVMDVDQDTPDLPDLVTGTPSGSRDNSNDNIRDVVDVPSPTIDQSSVGKGVSDGGFDRVTRVSPTTRYSANNSSEANVSLAKARTSFFAELFPNQ